MSYVSGRDFPNTFTNFNLSTFNYYKRDENRLKISNDFKNKLQDQIVKLINRIENEYKFDWKNTSVYTGTTGVAFTYFHIYENCNFLSDDERDNYLNKGFYLIENSLQHMKKKAVSFLAGEPGTLSVGAMFYKEKKMETEVDNCTKKIFEICDKEINGPDSPEELLYGKSGLLYSLLFLKHKLQIEVPNEYFSKISKIIIRIGKKYSISEKLTPQCPLMFQWHNSKYLGAAHGVSGILYILLYLISCENVSSSITSLIKPTLDYLITIKYPSGNFPSSLESSSDKLVQWCHGAPGWAFMFLNAYRVFGDKKYLDEAKGCAEVVWKRGLLKKGYGLCHGVAGNGYVFLALYNTTQDEKYLHYAAKFALWCCDYGNHGCRIADRPYSLFEGMSGTIHFLVDMLKPEKAVFPAFQLFSSHKL